MPATIENLDALLAAYRTLAVDVRASTAAIRHRYLELARENHPDKWPAASPQQETATIRMREINAAYDLIGSAPLLHHTFAHDPMAPPEEGPRHDDRSRTASALVETLVRMMLGAAVGGLIALRFHLSACRAQPSSRLFCRCCSGSPPPARRAGLRGRSTSGDGRSRLGRNWPTVVKVNSPEKGRKP